MPEEPELTAPPGVLVLVERAVVWTRLQQAVALEELEQELDGRRQHIRTDRGGNLVDGVPPVEKRLHFTEDPHQQRVCERVRGFGRPKLETAVSKVERGEPRREQGLSRKSQAGVAGRRERRLARLLAELLHGLGEAPSAAVEPQQQ